MTADSKISVDTFDLIRIVDIETEAAHRYRTWQVKANDELMKIVHVEEHNTSRDNSFWIPRPKGGKERMFSSALAERAETDRAPDFFV